MFRNELEIHIPTDEEEAAIQKDIALDPDAPELDADWFARARPAIEVEPRLVEHSLIRKTAGKYQAKGYDVSKEVPLDFIPGFRADLIVRKAGRTKVIEIKSWTSLAADPRIARIANIIDSKPEWTFELIFVGETENGKLTDDTPPLEPYKILHRIRCAEKKLHSEHTSDAFALAWSACAAATRALIAAEGVFRPDIAPVTYTLARPGPLKAIPSGQRLNPDNLRKYRNVAARNFTHPDLTPKMVTTLIAAATAITSQLAARELPDTKWFTPTRDALAALLQDSDIEIPNSPPSETSVLGVLTILAKILDSSAPPPSVVPTHEGGVQVEWHRNGVDLEIEISPDGNAEYFFASPDEEHKGAAWDEIERLTKHARTIL